MTEPRCWWRVIRRGRSSAHAWVAADLPALLAQVVELTKTWGDPGQAYEYDYEQVDDSYEDKAL